MVDFTSFTAPPLRSTKRRRLLAVMPSPEKASHILASFGAQKSPSSVTRLRRMQPAGQRDLRQRNSGVSYAESDISSLQNTPRSDRSLPEDVSSSVTSVIPISDDSEDGDEDEDDDEIRVVSRPRVFDKSDDTGVKDVKLRRSARWSLNNAPALKPSKRIENGRKRAPAKLLTSNTNRNRSVTVSDTARNRIRLSIHENTKPRRDAFFLANQDYFLPLLPPTSYIDKLQRFAAMNGDEEEPRVIPPEQISQPLGVKAVMKPYQLEGLSFLVYMRRNGMSSILGDEMGLGKTLQTLSLFQYLAETEPNRSGEDRPHLVICPLSVLSSWMNETRKWVPHLNVVRFQGTKSERDRLKQEMRPTQRGIRPQKSRSNAAIDMIVTTYETFTAERGWLQGAFAWRYCVLDEGHKIKNEKTDISSALQSLKAEFRLLLTGTPLQNNLHEMWALLHWLYPDVFGIETADTFKRAFDLSKGHVSTTFMDHARNLLELIMLRRMKSSPGVNLGLPPKEEILLYVPLTPMQRFWYTRLLTKADNAMLTDLFHDAKSKVVELKAEEQIEQKHLAILERGLAAADDVRHSERTDQAGNVWAESMEIIQQACDHDNKTDTKASDYKKLMNLLMQLRKVCSHPYLVPHAAPEPYYLGDHVKTASGKFIVLEKLVDELVIRRKKKVLIFSGFTKTLDLCEDLLALVGGNTYNPTFRYARLDGGTGRARRNLSIRLFNQLESDCKVMLISTRAGGLGINLASASDVIFMDEDWNPQITLQAESRAHRIGQVNPVTIYKICTQGTVEEQMMGRIRKKLYLSTKITESMRNIHSAAGQLNPGQKRKRLSRNEAAVDEPPQLGTSQLMTLIRKGAQTLVRPEVDVTSMLEWNFQTMIEKCRDKPDDPVVGGQLNSDAVVDEQEWLNTMERVECAVFEGRKIHKQLEEQIEQSELSRADRRVGKNTTVMIGGFAINKESLNCADWEAVPTFAGKDPRLAEPKKAKRDPIVNQDHCQICYEGGEILCCDRCPRSYHDTCLSDEMRSRARGMQFNCQQHECADCGAKTAEAGGLIYRCRWCPNGFCDDCLDPKWETMNLLKDTLPEFEMLGYGSHDTAWFIDCPECVQHWKDNPEQKKSIDKEKRSIDAQYKEFMMERV
nr:ISWI chromatin-remodeling complex ATPase CHR17-like [Quercus suber]POF16274.1 lymphocyte-specific helicase [Quercus suber]